MPKDPLRTKLCDMLGIEFPIVAFTHCKDVVDAVVNAGGFAVRGVTGAGAGTARRGRAQGTWTSSPLSVSRQRTITDILASEKVTAPREVVAALADVLPPDRLAMRSELEKFALYVGKGNTATVPLQAFSVVLQSLLPLQEVTP